MDRLSMLRAMIADASKKRQEHQSRIDALDLLLKDWREEALSLEPANKWASAVVVEKQPERSPPEMHEQVAEPIGLSLRGTFGVRSGTKKEREDAIERCLRTAGRPMMMREIASRIKQDGYPLSHNYVGTLLSRGEQFVRDGQLWSLKEWENPVSEVPESTSTDYSDTFDSLEDMFEDEETEKEDIE